MIDKEIEEILDIRHGRNEYEGHGHLQAITRMIEFVTLLKSKLRTYSEFRENVLSQIKTQKGEYYQMSLEDPMFEQAVEGASADELNTTLKQVDSELDRLYRRFDRETINISVVGRARQGKSCLLQSIAGLNDSVIPTSDGDDCTGTISVIYNVPQQKEANAKVICYSEYDLVSQINLYLEVLGMMPTIGSITQIPGLSHRIAEFAKTRKERSATDQSRFEHLRNYVEHYNGYKDLIGKTFPIKQSEIRNYAAQYDANYARTYNYLAVDKVEIFKEFNNPEVGKVVLVDTIGLGDTKLGIREKMIKTLREDSDAAILVRMPASTGDGIREEDDKLYNLIQDAIGQEHLSQWLFLAINQDNRANGNVNAVKAMKKAFDDRELSFAFIEIVDCHNKLEVYNKLLAPLLKKLAKHIASIDAALISETNEILNTAYNEFFTLCARIASVIKGGLKSELQSGGLFDDLFEDSLGLTVCLNELNQKYSDSNAESQEIKSEVMKILKGISQDFPSAQEIKDRLISGGPNAYVENVYNYYADNVRANIRDRLDALNSTVINGLQEKVKNEISDVLRNDKGGRLGRIPLQSDNTTESMMWLKSLINEKLSEYPILKSALQDVFEYRLNIEGLLEYKANFALSCFDQESPNFVRLPAEIFSADLSKKIDIIRQTLIANIPIVANTLMESIQELLKIPANSFNACIRKFRERLIFKQEGRRELKNFYRENATAIWADEFRNIASQAAATGKWSEITDELNSLRDKARFIISLN